ncbi:hypothetical protein SAMN02745245_01132 [Anaerosphaera aminiphila DSM 21120]|uniref:Uncharacterized protein n=1 Tax=Anaerosphaera aminiphila DSM 21120 TaxID=1120995 RepID=A0A1M5SB85_9FIRM|nr:hypothetical protein [Anaerosphaera aminiphila]SHH35710.1 hypothetical protein SAMN02745245_01132 [Anaerosphaera aminiphila DSM 21120]
MNKNNNIFDDLDEFIIQFLKGLVAGFIATIIIPNPLVGIIVFVLVFSSGKD